MAVEKSLLSGSTAMLILKLLEEKECMGMNDRNSSGAVRKCF